MKVNKDLLAQSLASILKDTNSISASINTLYNLNLINEKTYLEVNDIINKDFTLKKFFNALKFNSNFIEYTNFFSNYYSLSDSIIMASEIIMQIKRLKNEIISSLIYPVILILLSFLALIFVTNFIIPQLAILSPSSMSDFKFIIMLINFVPLFLLTIIILCLVIFFLFIILLKNDFKNTVSLINKIPLINKGLRFYSSITFMIYIKEITKNMLLNKDCLMLLKEQVNNKFVCYIIDDMLLKLNRGKSISTIIKESMLINQDLKYIMQSCLNSKDVAKQLDSFYQLKINLLNKKLKMFISIIVPVVVSLIGVMLILMYLLIMLPILNVDLSM